MTKTDTSASGLPPPDWADAAAERLGPEPKSTGQRRREIVEADILATLSAVVRRPPALSHGRGGAAGSGSFERILIDQAAPLLRMPTAQLAGTVSDMVLRRQALCKAAGDGEALSGLAALNLLARMFEHLAVMQSK